MNMQLSFDSDGSGAMKPQRSLRSAAAARAFSLTGVLLPLLLLSVLPLQKETEATMTQPTRSE